MTAAELDQRYVWHPFTQMKEWSDAAQTPVVIAEGQGAWLTDTEGRRYLDGNSSIWTNVHGHRHAPLDAALLEQLGKLAHCSALGLANEPAARLAKELAERLQPGGGRRVFFSDDGSTAVEAALKMAWQARVQRGETERKRFISLGKSYHGDTVGAMSAAHSALFHKTYGALMFESREVMPPVCYRCPYNRAKPERGVEARAGRQCERECVGELKRALDEEAASGVALVMEPLVQMVAGVQPHPEGYLREAAALCRERGIWLLLDEVFTGFGRTGALFACQKEQVQPDMIALAKGLTGGYLPLAATVASSEIYEAFLGEYAELKTFFHGHSYTGNPLGCAVALANLRCFDEEQTLTRIAAVAEGMRKRAKRFWEHPHVGDVRQEGIVLGIELVADFESQKPFAFTERVGGRICEAARRHGLLTRPIGDVILLLPPACITEAELDLMFEAAWRAINEVLPV